jgi:hypothetical protein
LKPVVPQPELCPIVTSLKVAAALEEYKRGFKNPRGGRPLRRRASFQRATMPAKAGDEAEVPPIRIGLPLT